MWNDGKFLCLSILEYFCWIICLLVRRPNQLTFTLKLKKPFLKFCYTLLKIHAVEWVQDWMSNGLRKLTNVTQGLILCLQFHYKESNHQKILPKINQLFPHRPPASSYNWTLRLPSCFSRLSYVFPSSGELLSSFLTDSAPNWVRLSVCRAKPVCSLFYLRHH